MMSQNTESYRILFRTDSSLQIGSGHVMRCLTLADELRERGATVSFICREHPGNMIDLIERKGYRVVRLPEAEAEYIATLDELHHASWLGVSWQQDAAETVNAIAENRPDWLIIDHYAIDYRWEQILRPQAGKIMVIDDIADRQHDCDLLLDQNLYGDINSRYDGLVPGSCRKLLGPKYALLRPEFAAARKNLRQRDGIVKRILVFFGGVDPTNETEKTLHAITKINDRQFDVDVVVGGGNPHKEQIQQICAEHKGFHYHCQVDNMAELMAGADLAIGAGGATTWERCALGLPSLVITLAENQVNIAQSANNAGVLKYIGYFKMVSFEVLSQIINDALASKDGLVKISEHARILVDSAGVIRTADKMEQL